MKVGTADVDSRDRAAVKAAFNVLYSQVTTEMNAVWSRIGPTEPSAPIYHYTTAAGLNGIMKDRAIFLTDAFYLSDKTELRYGRNLVSEVLAEFTIAASGEIQRFLREKVGEFDPFTGVVQATFYVASFCERADLLSQWRTYGGGGAGFALGFPADTFNNADRFDRSATVSPNLHRIEYDRDTQRQVVTYVVKHCTDMLSADMATAKDARERKLLGAGHLALLLLQLTALVSTFKHPMFSEEREWRLTLSRLRGEEDGLSCSALRVRIWCRSFRVLSSSLVQVVCRCAKSWCRQLMNQHCRRERSGNSCVKSNTRTAPLRLWSRHFRSNFASLKCRLTALSSCQAAGPLARRPSRLGRLELHGGMAAAPRSLRTLVVSRGGCPAAAGLAREAACSLE